MSYAAATRAAGPEQNWLPLCDSTYLDDDAAGASTRSSRSGAARSCSRTRSRPSGGYSGRGTRRSGGPGRGRGRLAAGRGGGQDGPQRQDDGQDKENGAGDDGGSRRDCQTAWPTHRILGVGRARQTHEVVQGPVPGASPDAHAFDAKSWGWSPHGRPVCPVESTRNRPPVATGLRRRTGISGPGGRGRRRCRGPRGPRGCWSPRRPEG